MGARRGELLDKVKEQCIAKGGSASQILVLPLDLCNYAGHKAAFEKVVETSGRLDILVNNAGRSQRARWEHTDIKVDEDLFALNVFSALDPRFQACWRWPPRKPLARVLVNR